MGAKGGAGDVVYDVEVITADCKVGALALEREGASFCKRACQGGRKTMRLLSLCSDWWQNATWGGCAVTGLLLRLGSDLQRGRQTPLRGSHSAMA